VPEEGVGIASLEGDEIAAVFACAHLRRLSFTVCHVAGELMRSCEGNDVAAVCAYLHLLWLFHFNQVVLPNRVYVRGYVFAYFRRQDSELGIFSQTTEREGACVEVLSVRVTG